MAVWHLRSKRAATGKKLTRNRKKKRGDRGTRFLETRIGERNAKIKRCKGANTKVKLKEADTVNLTDPKTKKATKAKILTVKENPANPHYVRRNILTKGSVIQTDKGSARITSRPGQHGLINAVLVPERK
jgi:small subunit ribosomal protein S8e